MIQCSLLPCYLILDINPTQYVIIGAKNEKSHHKKIYLKFYRFIKTSAQTTKNRHSCLPMMTVVDASANVIKKNVHVLGPSRYQFAYHLYRNYSFIER